MYETEVEAIFDVAYCQYGTFLVDVSDIFSDAPVCTTTKTEQTKSPANVL